MRELTEGVLLAGRYTLIKPVGPVGNAIVWLATDKRAQSKVALKFADVPGGGARPDQLQSEWRINSRLMHANIIRVFEFHDLPDGVFYAMQYIDGPNISVLSTQPIEVLLRPIGLLADALRYAHGKSIVHRDIKASNVALDARGVPYLLDFGVASAVGEQIGGGSDISASPQQLAALPAAPADDVYSLGVLICELIGGSPVRTIAQLDTLRDASGAALPSQLNGLLAEMLSERDVNRPSAEEIASRLTQMGFPAGPAPAEVSSTVKVDRQIRRDGNEIVRPQRRPAKVAPAASTPATSKGVPASALYGGLALLLLVLLAVLFVLPATVTDQQQPEIQKEVADQPDPVSAQESDSAAVASDDTSEPGFQLNTQEAADDDQGPVGFSENLGQFSGDSAAQLKAATDEALGDLLSRLERLKFRAIDRWGGQTYLDALDVYAEGDRAYLLKDHRSALSRYQQAIQLLDPFFDRIESEFNAAMDQAKTAFDSADHIDAVKFYDLAVAITPGNVPAEAGLARALNLKSVLDLIEQAQQFENDLEYEAAKIALEQAVSLDGAWQPAKDALDRVRGLVRQFSFERRMTEGLDALAARDFLSARAAFEAAKKLDANSRQPTDGLLQVDQEIRLEKIRSFEKEAVNLEHNEEWESAINTYEKILEIDGDLQFAQAGLANARQRTNLHNQLNAYIDDPDSLSAPGKMQRATTMLLDMSRISPIGPRLENQKNTLSRLLKRAATPLDVLLVSDSLTNVDIFKVARLGSFENRQLSLRPGVYVAVGSRAGYRDVRIEFRVAPEIEMRPIVVQCEEAI